jgi:hypothetical protein
MKFVKVIIDGKEYYRMVDDENTVEETTGEPEFVDADIEQGEEPTGGEKFLRDTQEFFEKVGTGAKEFGEKIVAGAKDLGERIKNGTERLFAKDKSLDPNSTEAKLLRLLPYMSAEEAHKVCEKILANDTSFKNLDMATVMPFLSAEDCDALFVKAIETDKKCDLATATPYVSAKCLAGVVDAYIDGKYPSLDIDSLYPFLADTEIKKIFYHIIGEKKD